MTKHQTIEQKRAKSGKGAGLSAKGGSACGGDFTPKGKSKWPDPKERSGAKFYFPGLTLTAQE